jgi:hypothetical protein
MLHVFQATEMNLNEILIPCFQIKGESLSCEAARKWAPTKRTAFYESHYIITTFIRASQWSPHETSLHPYISFLEDSLIII